MTTLVHEGSAIMIREAINGWWCVSIGLAFALTACSGADDRRREAASSQSEELTQGSLPGGTIIEVDIDIPTNGAVLPNTPISVAGTARIDKQVVTTDVVYILDVSGSTEGFSGCGADQNGDGASNTILDCEIAALRAVTDQILAIGGVANIGVGLFAATGAVADMSPAGGIQLLTPADADSNGANGRDVDEVLTSADSGSLGNFAVRSVNSGATNFASGVSQAVSILATSTADRKVVIFISDGANNAGPNVATVTGTIASGTIVHLIAAGPSSSCASNPSGLGSLNDIASQTGGDCTNVPNVADLPNVAPALVVSTLNTVTLRVDGSPAAVDTISPTPPQNGPASVNWSTTLHGLAAGVHEICAIAPGTDGLGAGSVTECVTIRINNAPSALCRALILNADATCGASGAVDNASFDPDGDTFSCVQSPPGPYALGTTTVTLTCTDQFGASNSCQADVAVVDTTPPVVTVSGGGSGSGSGSLWPPNHQYVTKSLADCGVQINDQCQGVIDLQNANPTVTCVTSDELEDAAGNGDGSTLADMVIVNATTVQLRAERSGGLNGRVYKINFQVRDAAGNATTAVCPVSVVLDQSPSSVAVDSGVHFSVGTCN
jgi:hypothetical protein